MKFYICIFAICFLTQSNSLANNEIIVDKHEYCYEKGIRKIQDQSIEKTKEFLAFCFTHKGLADLVTDLWAATFFLEDEEIQRLNSNFNMPDYHNGNKKIEDWIEEVEIAQFLKDFFVLWLDGESIPSHKVMYIHGSNIYASYDLSPKGKSWEMYSYKNTKLGWKIDSYKPETSNKQFKNGRRLPPFN